MERVVVKIESSMSPGGKYEEEAIKKFQFLSPWAQYYL